MSCLVYTNFVVLHAANKAKYDAWEEDVAIVNIFFGKETVIGHFHISSRRAEKYKCLLVGRSKNMYGLYCITAIFWTVR